MSWGDSVKPGQHFAGTLDHKGRGKAPICLSFLDEEDEDENREPPKVSQLDKNRKEKQYMRDQIVNKTVNDDVDDDDFEMISITQRRFTRNKRKLDGEELPDLIVEEDTVNTRQGVNTSSVQGRKLLPETQSFFAENKTKRSIRPVRVKPEPNSTFSYADSDKPKASRAFRVVGESSMTEPRQVTRVCPVPKINRTSENTTSVNKKMKQTTILVQETQTFDNEREPVVVGSKGNLVIAETQNDFDEEEVQLAIKRSKEDMDTSASQSLDNDIEFLDVKQTSRGAEFENPMHKSKLLGYHIPKKAKDEGVWESAKKVSVEETDVIQQTETQNVRRTDNKVPTVGKYTGKKQPVALVAETQDPEDENVDVSRKHLPQKKGKRKTFRLHSASSEDECIPESQNYDTSPEVTYKQEEEYVGNKVTIGNDSSSQEEQNKDSDKREVKLNQKVYLNSHGNKTDAKSKASVSKFKRQRSNDDSDEEESQSPIIKHKHRKVWKSEVQDEGENLAATVQEKEIGHVTVKGGNSVSKLPTISERQNKRGSDYIESVSKGVKKLFSRPVSTESDVSEASTTSSCVSAAMLDEKGDLYSTQIGELKKRKGRKRSTELNKEINREDSAEEILCLDDSDDNLEVTKIVSIQKTYSKKKPLIINQSKDANSVFSGYSSAKPKLASTSDIDLDPNANRSLCILPSLETSVNMSDTGDLEESVGHDVGDRLDEEEDPVGRQSERHKPARASVQPVTANIPQVGYNRNKKKRFWKISMLFCH